jgi:NhaP-type Na+/H+ or K+/H+ antiporter
MEEDIIALGAIILMLLMILYMIAGTMLEHYKCIIGHEAGLTMLVGMLIAFIARELHEDENPELTQAFLFDENIFFYVALPPIVFATAFNMKRKMFFASFDVIMLLGVCSTLIQFSLISFFLSIGNDLDIYTMSLGTSG